ncbi:MAG: ATP-binding cassette domain-containing protein, partial [Bryobacteraceae bacterium]
MNKDSSQHHGIPPFRRLRLLVRAETRDLWVAVVYSAAIGLMTLVVPIATQSLVNTVAFGTLLQPLVVLTLLVFLGLCFATLLQGFRTWIVEIIQRRFFVRVAGDVAHRVLRARPEAFDGGHGPEVVNRFLEVVTVQKSAAMLLIDGLSILMQTVIGMILLAVYHPWLLAFDVLLLASIAIVLFPMGSGAVATSIQESKAKYELMAWLEELARHPLTFKSVNGTSLALVTTNTLTSHWLKYRSRHFRILLRQIVGSFILQAAASSVLLGVGGWLVIQRQLTLGQLIAAEIVVALVVSGFTKFGKTLEVFYDMLAAVDKLGYLTDLPLENTGVEPLPANSAGIAVSLRNVGLGYAHNPRVLEGLTWEIPAGARVGLRGNSGGGKSTLVNMLYGLRSPESGVVELDGVDLRDIRLNDVRSQVSLVRENEIFQGSIAARKRG